MVRDYHFYVLKDHHWFIRECVSMNSLRPMDEVNLWMSLSKKYEIADDECYLAILENGVCINKITC